MKVCDPRDIVTQGWLLEINRIVFNPRGFALCVEAAPSTLDPVVVGSENLDPQRPSLLVSLVDHREEGGIEFGPPVDEEDRVRTCARIGALPRLLRCHEELSVISSFPS